MTLPAPGSHRPASEPARRGVTVPGGPVPCHPGLVAGVTDGGLVRLHRTGTSVVSTFVFVSNISWLHSFRSAASITTGPTSGPGTPYDARAILRSEELYSLEGRHFP